MGCELLRRGVETRVIDACAQATDKSKALGVQARTLEALDGMGIADRFVTAGRKIHGVNAYADGARIVHVSLDDIDSPYSYTLSLPQADTERLLAEHLADLGGRVEREVKLIGLAQNRGGVTATLDTGRRAAGDRAGRMARGLRRRAQHDAHDARTAFRRRAVRGVLHPRRRSRRLGAARRRVHASSGRDGAMAAFPLPKGRWRLVGECDPPQPTLDDFTRLLHERGAPKAQLSDGGLARPVPHPPPHRAALPGGARVSRG